MRFTLVYMVQRSFYTDLGSQLATTVSPLSALNIFRMIAPFCSLLAICFLLGIFTFDDRLLTNTITLNAPSIFDRKSYLISREWVQNFLGRLIVGIYRISLGYMVWGYQIPYRIFCSGIPKFGGVGFSYDTVKKVDPSGSFWFICPQTWKHQ